ncbi:DUF2254 family protein [Nonlabens sp.]|uniref:DUF2254 family protein n=1 Tax=Nonlabens sp. TaxID=1888209 RepID=UPI003F6A26D5
MSAFVALAAFVYFIYSISSSTQINNILENIYNKAAIRLENLIEQEKNQKKFPDTSNWHVYQTEQSGTIQNISVEGLKKCAKNFETQLEVVIVKGQYILKETDMFISKNELEASEIQEILKNFNYSESELVSDNYALGFKQITEIGIKSMSPGINDPGTAINTIDYLTDLVRIRMQKEDHSISSNDNNEPILKMNVIAFELLLHNVLASYRNYCKHDLSVMQKLLQLLDLCLGRTACHTEYYKVLYQQAELLIDDAKESISNQHDLNLLQSQFKKIASKFQEYS